MSEIVDMAERIRQVQNQHTLEALQRQDKEAVRYTSQWDHLHSVYEDKKPAYTKALREVEVRKPVTIHSWEDAMQVCEIPHIYEALNNFSDSPSHDNAVCLVRFILEIGN